MINVVCAVIFNSERKVLACQRPVGGLLSGKWEFPGGKIERGEKPEQALVREIKEELGCNIRVGPALPEVIHDYQDLTVRLLAYKCILHSGKPQALEHREIRWVDVQEAQILDWAEADIPILKNLGDTA